MGMWTQNLKSFYLMALLAHSTNIYHGRQLTFERWTESCIDQPRQEGGVVGVLRQATGKGSQRVAMLAQVLKRYALTQVCLKYTDTDVIQVHYNTLTQWQNKYSNTFTLADLK